MSVYFPLLYKGQGSLILSDSQAYFIHSITTWFERKEATCGKLFRAEVNNKSTYEY